MSACRMPLDNHSADVVTHKSHQHFNSQFHMRSTSAGRSCHPQVCQQAQAHPEAVIRSPQLGTGNWERVPEKVRNAFQMMYVTNRPMRSCHASHPAPPLCTHTHTHTVFLQHLISFPDSGLEDSATHADRHSHSRKTNLATDSYFVSHISHLIPHISYLTFSYSTMPATFTRTSKFPHIPPAVGSA